MRTLIIGNKVYSSWSLRGWLALRQAGLPFEEVVVSLYDDAWPARRAQPDLAPSAGRVPLLWDGDVAVWDSLAIIEHCAEATAHELFWPADPAARAFARSIAAEMHAGFAALRTEHGMNLRHRFDPAPLSPAVEAEVARIVALWTEARSKWGGAGPFLFSAFGAADIMFAPVVTRFETYQIALPPIAVDYCAAIRAHPFMLEWTQGAMAEDWVIEKFEPARA